MGRHTKKRKKVIAKRNGITLIKKPCLKCGKVFDSVGNHNRLCDRCNQDNGRVHITKKNKN